MAHSWALRKAGVGDQEQVGLPPPPPPAAQSPGSALGLCGSGGEGWGCRLGSRRLSCPADRDTLAPACCVHGGEGDHARGPEPPDAGTTARWYCAPCRRDCSRRPRLPGRAGRRWARGWARERPTAPDRISGPARSRAACASARAAAAHFCVVSLRFPEAWAGGSSAC